MSNHGKDPHALPDDLQQHFLDRWKQDGETELSRLADIRRLTYPDREGLGETGRFLLGKMTPEDQGETRFAIAADPQTKTIIFDFGKPVTWLAMPRADVEQLITLLTKKIKEL